MPCVLAACSLLCKLRPPALLNPFPFCAKLAGGNGVDLAQSSQSVSQYQHRARYFGKRKLN